LARDGAAAPRAAAGGGLFGAALPSAEAARRRRAAVRFFSREYDQVGRCAERFAVFKSSTVAHD
jgi:hypothetical protein